MTATTAEPISRQRGLFSGLIHRQLDSYPDTGPRVGYLALTVLATITLYYELYVNGSVSTLILTNLHMTFTFYVYIGAFGALVGAFGSLLAGLTDRFGRANLVVFGLLFAGVFVAFVIPAATNKWSFTIETFVVGFVEGICLVATPALIRDFSPQVGRATAMGFWTSGPVLGSLIVSVVGTATIPTLVHDPRFWTHEFRICGIAGIVVFLITLVGLRELSPQLRDQLMVTLRDRALIEARAKGIDVLAALRHPFRQLLKADVVVSAFAVSFFLLIYYAAVGFLVIYMGVNFGFSLKQSNGLGNWEWGVNALAVVMIGLISDRFRVRKPFMVIGAVAGAVMTVVFLSQFGHHPSYYKMATIVAVLSFCLGVAYVAWMASFTETVEAHNPALTATGLAIWGWIIRMVVFGSALIIPAVITSVTPLVVNGPTVQAYAARYPAYTWAGSHGKIVAEAKQYSTQLTFAATHPTIVAIALKDKVELANYARLKPEIAVIEKNPALFLQAAKYPQNKVPPKLAAKLLAVSGGGTTGLTILTTIAANQAAIQGIVAVQADLLQLAPYGPQLTALGRVPASVIADVSPPAVQKELGLLQSYPPAVTAYMNAHGGPVAEAASQSASQWRTWWWVCFGGMIFFLGSVPLMKGRWRPSSARRDEQEHEAMMQAELTKLQGASA